MQNPTRLLMSLCFLTLSLGETFAASSSAQTGIDRVHTLRIQASGSRYEPLHYITPYSQSRHVSDYSSTLVWRPADNKARLEWQLHTIYPYPAELDFWSVYDGNLGERTGVDGFRPSGDGPIHPARIGATFKDLWLANPLILKRQAEQLPTTRVVHNGVTYEHQSLFTMDTQWSLLSDPETGLPAELSTLETDPLEGQVSNRVVFSDWREVSGIPFPHRLEQYIDDKIIRREIREHIEVNPAGADEQLRLSDNFQGKGDAELQSWGWSMSNFFTRRMGLGAPADQDQSKQVEFHEVGQGIYQILGSSHHNLLIVGPHGLAIVDAVWYPQRSESILRSMREKWPDKDLKYVILTHHHMDHTGGLMPFVDAGASIITGSGNEPYFQRILQKAYKQTPQVSTVQGQATFDGIGRSVNLYEVLTNHADSFLAVYVEDEKLLFNTDLYSPGAPKQQVVWARELLDAVDFYQLPVHKHVGAHSVGSKPHSDLVELLGTR